MLVVRRLVLRASEGVFWRSARVRESPPAPRCQRWSLARHYRSLQYALLAHLFCGLPDADADGVVGAVLEEREAQDDDDESVPAKELVGCCCPPSNSGMFAYTASVLIFSLNCPSAGAVKATAVSGSSRLPAMAFVVEDARLVSTRPSVLYTKFRAQ